MNTDKTTLVEILKTQGIRFEFIKKNGDKRILHACRWQDIPGYNEEDAVKDAKAKSEDLLVVYENGVGWRSLHVSSIVKYEVI
jgi:hypothetical protein